MQAPVTLPYARRSRRWTRKRKLAVILLAVATSAVGCFGYRVYKNIRPRVELLSNHPQLGPVDWTAVLTSPTLCRLAWELSSHWTAIWEFGREPNGLGGVTLFGVNPEDLEVGVRFPLKYGDGQLTLCITVQNGGTNAVLIPPFGWLQSRVRELSPRSVPGHLRRSSTVQLLRELGVRNGDGSSRARRLLAADLADLLREPQNQALDAQTRYTLLVDCSTMRNWLGSGVSVLKAGETKTIELSFPAPQKPAHMLLSVRTTGYTTISFELGTPSRTFEAYDAWEAVPRSMLRRDVRTWETSGPRRLLLEGLLPPVLFPDEHGTQPWERTRQP